MKVILGDNQFFGINHVNQTKGDKDKHRFSEANAIADFIESALNTGLDGFMINANSHGYKIVQDPRFHSNQIHYSIPYPHKYATLVNEKGLVTALAIILSRQRFGSVMDLIRFCTRQDVHALTRLLIATEIPKKLPQDAIVYLQNIITDMIIGLNDASLLRTYVRKIRSLGYQPGLITLNPVKLDLLLSSIDDDLSDLIVCYNINNIGFNVFPNLESVIEFTYSKSNYKKMGMSILSSGAAHANEAINFVKNLPLDYVVFGSSKIKNIKANLRQLQHNYIADTLSINSL